jgi:hypothetical protein
MTPTDAELYARRVDAYQQWWDAHSADWQDLPMDERDRLWALCRLAWYAGRQHLTETR